MASNNSFLNSFISKIVSVASKYDGKGLAQLLYLPTSPSDDAKMNGLAQQIGATKNFKKYCFDHLDRIGIDSDVFALRLEALQFCMLGDYDNAYKNMLDAFEILLEIVSQEPFLVHLLTRYANDLRLIALLSDTSSSTASINARPVYTNLRNCQTAITKAFTTVAKDRNPITDPHCKKLAIFSVTNVLFKIYFKLNTLQLMGKLIKQINQTPVYMQNLKLFPLCDVVTYQYYVGRLSLFEDNIEKARECLRFAFEHCPRYSQRNRQRILTSLVPINMSLGLMPTLKISTDYGLSSLVELGNAAQVGDLQTFNRVFSENRAVFIRMGIYLVIEQAKGLVYRNLFKRFHLITQSTRLSIEEFKKAMTWLGEDVDLDEIECILANLIFDKKVKGYLSHGKRILVVGKSDPFPTDVVKRAKI